MSANRKAAKADDSLAAFAQTFTIRAGVPCWACGIPEAAEIAREYRAGARLSAIVAWLQQRRGYKPSVATASRVGNHLRHHVRREAA